MLRRLTGVGGLLHVHEMFIVIVVVYVVAYIVTIEAETEGLGHVRKDGQSSMGGGKRTTVAVWK